MLVSTPLHHSHHVHTLGTLSSSCTIHAFFTTKILTLSPQSFYAPCCSTYGVFCIFCLCFVSFQGSTSCLSVFSPSNAFPALSLSTAAGGQVSEVGGPSASPNQAEPAFLFCFQFFFSCHLTLNRCRGPGQGARRTINLEARAAPPNQAEPAPISTSRSDGSTDSDAAQQAELDESPHVPTGVTNGDDIFQSAEDELEPNNVRAKTNAQVGLC